jgi:hypothetical protein
VWTLRVWKIREMDALALTEREKEEEVRNADALGREETQQRLADSRKRHAARTSVFKAMFVVQRV